MATETKKTFEELAYQLSQCPKFGTYWKHYKTGNSYRVVGGAIDESRQIPVVLYRPERNTSVTFARPLSEWEEEVEHEGRKIKRFTPES